MLEVRYYVDFTIKRIETFLLTFNKGWLINLSNWSCYPKKSFVTVFAGFNIEQLTGNLVFRFELELKNKLFFVS